MKKPQIGLVIPIVQRKYIISLIQQINKTVHDNDIVICVVNDGNNKIENYLNKYLPKEIELLNLENNLCFAGANNAGWKLLINKYPSIKYLGSINDDTDPQDQWLKYLVQSMETNSNIGACGPVMITYANKFFKRKIKYTSTWKLGTKKTPMIIDKKKITSDTYVSVLGGFCFLAKAKALLQIDYFDVKYQNSCEDIDLCLKLRKSNWNLVVSSNSLVVHKCGKSRFKTKNYHAKISNSRKLLISKWGNNLEKYNL